MPECSFHPGVETRLQCSECGRYICPRDMVVTSVSQKCPICAKQPKSALVHLRPKQLAGAIGFGLLAGIGGAVALGIFRLPFIGFILAFMWGGLAAEAVHRGSGGHRGGVVTAIAIGSIVFGGLVSWFVLPLFGIAPVGLLLLAIAAFGAAGDAASWRMRR